MVWLENRFEQCTQLDGARLYLPAAAIREVVALVHHEEAQRTLHSPRDQIQMAAAVDRVAQRVAVIGRRAAAATRHRRRRDRALAAVGVLVLPHFLGWGRGRCHISPGSPHK